MIALADAMADLARVRGQLVQRVTGRFGVMGEVIPLQSPFASVLVEITKPGTQKGWWVDIVYANGETCMWCGAGLDEARRAARESPTAARGGRSRSAI